MSESVELRPYFAPGERYPSLVGVRVGGDEYETAYVSKADLMSVMDENAKLQTYISEVESDNAKLRQELDQWERLTANIELPEYPVTEFRPKELERENAKLRELVRYMWVYDYAGNFSTLQEHIDHSAIVYQRMRELGVEVDE